MHTLTRIILLVLFSSLGLRQTMLGQNECEAYFPMRHGASFEVTTYDHKGKTLTLTTTEIEEKERSIYRVLVEAKNGVTNPKQTIFAKSSMNMSCQDGEFRMDMSGMLNSPPQTQGLVTKMEASELKFPANIQPGMELEGCLVNVKNYQDGKLISDNTIRIYDRKCTGQETITTSAGTFDCVIVEHDLETHIMGFSKKSHFKAWLNKGAGYVRAEISSKGKLEIYSLLTKLNP